MSMKTFPLRPRTPTGTPRFRQLLAAALRLAGAALEQLALRLHVVDAAPPHEPLLEFYAEAGAPEGALYVDGRLVGYLEGVQRL